MDELELRVEPFDFGGGGEVEDHVVIVVNGRDLRDLIRDTEMAQGAADGLGKTTAGTYGGLPPHVVFFPARHLLGEDLHSEYDYLATAGSLIPEGKTPVLRCVCGDYGCALLCARIAVHDDVVVWDQLEDPHVTQSSSQSPYEGLGAFRFDRRRYEAALGGGAGRSRV